MKVFNKFLAIIFSVLLAIISLITLFMALGWTTPLDYLNSAFSSFNLRWIIGITSVVILIAALNLFFVNFVSHPVTHTKIDQNDQGEISITLPAVEALVKKAAFQIKGVREVKPVIKCTPEGIAIFMRTGMQPGTVIPQSAQELQAAVKAYLEQTAGLQVVETKVLITNVSSQENKSRVD
ncbi:hypothetical protein DCMF_03805 [Candidatus Formimonas warabiya]|uniref:Alkaline shock response membrane anchor protein AmaP n=2 Tax=Formimonas warabiya TaxID=1761012 RepID=A0A3G1KNG5_FORW1|nr:hypothetical protein DCMF_03805 [Candidatus Formimonas warabiya]